MHMGTLSVPACRPVNGYPGIPVPDDERVPGQYNETQVNVPGTTAVVINTSRLALISAATKACTFRVVALLQSATKTGHSSWRQEVGVVERARWSGVG